jgi:N-acetylmuramic acid 6-phosphate etherase
MIYKVPPTEKLDKRKKPIDQLNDQEALKVMLNSQAESILAVRNNLENLENIVLEIYCHLSKSDEGRIIYTGAGTSARIGVQDGAELYPTFGWPRNRVGFLIAGAKKALFESIENAEDNILKVLDGIDGDTVCEKDVIIALAASGNTPYTCEVTKKSNQLGALTLGIANNKECKLLNESKLKVFLDTGPEVVSGSTRLKAGTSQKICLNLISTLLMSKFGRIKNGYMSHMVATNEKLRLREKEINKLDLI